MRPVVLGSSLFLFVLSLAAHTGAWLELLSFRSLVWAPVNVLAIVAAFIADRALLPEHRLNSTGWFKVSNLRPHLSHRLYVVVRGLYVATYAFAAIGIVLMLAKAKPAEHMLLVMFSAAWAWLFFMATALHLRGEPPNPSIERTCPGKPGHAAHVER